jgi:hypothetical protein
VVQVVLQGTYNYIHGNSTSSTNGIASSFVANIVTVGSVYSTVTIYHGGTGFVAGRHYYNSIGSSVGGSANLVLTVATLENNNASNMFLLNNRTNLVQMTMQGLTGTAWCWWYR